MSFLNCAGTRPTNLGVSEAGLAPCPTSPNCVSSDAADSGHAIAPFELAVPEGQAWHSAVSAVSALPRTKIVTERDGYLHAECRSAVFGFVDDLELELRAADQTIAVRSASRLGVGDFGVNRRRVESLRQELRSQGALRPAGR
ncbi:MAG: DUF1499 domain-containing protein [Myxococcales bacterium]|nr:DUF1499 domain-containing protein [Myxococcales bacterium]